MHDLRRKSGAALALFTCALGASAETSIRFDSVAPKDQAPVSMLQAVREAMKDAELPAVGVAREARPGVALPKGAKAEPAFWGSDGQWCPDGQVYRGGPCDWGGGWRDPYNPPYRGPYRDPYYDPYHPPHRGPYRDPYWDPYRGPYRDPYYRGPWRGGGSPYRGPGQGPTREPWRDPPTRGRWRR